MIYSKIIEAFYHQPLALTRAGFDSIDAILRPRVFHGVKAERPETDFFGNAMPQMEIENGIAVIPIFGPLLQHAGLLDKQCGATSYDDIKKDIQSATNRSDVKAAILNCNSPGGSVLGCLELAEYIAEIQEETGIPIYAFTDSQMASACYFLAAGCYGIYSTKTAFVGSIGVMMGFIDSSKAYEMAGLKPELFVSGKLKGTASDGVPVSDEQRTYLQGLVDAAFEDFQGHVLAHRDSIDDGDMEGQCFYGKDANAKGLTDGICASIEELIEIIG